MPCGAYKDVTLFSGWGLLMTLLLKKRWCVLIVNLSSGHGCEIIALASMVGMHFKLRGKVGFSP